MDEALGARVSKAIISRGWTLAVAESCTGGLIGHRITQVPGSSEYFLGGVISYSDRIKMELLGVSKTTLVSDGAVSEATARQMAMGIRARFGASLGVSATGIAGPSGGSEQKPVGLTWVAAATPSGEWTERFVFQGDRATNKAQAADEALRLILKVLELDHG
jgi:nicotinamide-nucleotide amidase